MGVVMLQELEIGRQRTSAQVIAAVKDRGSLVKRPRWGEDLIRAVLLFCGAVSIFTTLGIVYVIGKEALLFFTSTPGFTFVKFFTQTTWAPETGSVGILPLLTSTLITSFMAMLVAIPLGLGSAVYLSEYASPKVRATLKPILEILAGIPTVVYGYFALTVMTPLLRSIFGETTVNVYNMASAGLVMGIMILPTISSMSEDALSAVPRSLREASYGLGGTKLETVIKVVLPAALSGILAAAIIGISRAVGETMIVALAAGAGPNFTFNPFQSAETMTGHIARISGGDLSYDSIQYNSLFAIGMTLFVMTLALNLFSRWVSKRFREVYQ
jgi:phosphate transport system permease protein